MCIYYVHTYTCVKITQHYKATATLLQITATISNRDQSLIQIVLDRGNELFQVIIHIYMELSQGNQCITILNKQKCLFLKTKAGNMKE
jgi:hypothetical protein